MARMSALQNSSRLLSCSAMGAALGVRGSPHPPCNPRELEQSSKYTVNDLTCALLGEAYGLKVLLQPVWALCGCRDRFAVWPRWSCMPRPSQYRHVAKRCGTPSELMER
jgi:hypothetical protein